MGTRLYVGNLSYNTSESQLRDLFAPFGGVQTVQLIMDRDTGRSKGFAFVEMGSDQEAQAAIEGMNGKMVDGRSLAVTLQLVETLGDRAERLLRAEERRDHRIDHRTVEPFRPRLRFDSVPGEGRSRDERRQQRERAGE